MTTLASLPCSLPWGDSVCHLEWAQPVQQLECVRAASRVSTRQPAPWAGGQNPMSQRASTLVADARVVLG